MEAHDKIAAVFGPERTVFGVVRVLSYIESQDAASPTRRPSFPREPPRPGKRPAAPLQADRLGAGWCAQASGLVIRKNIPGSFNIGEIFPDIGTSPRVEKIVAALVRPNNTRSAPKSLSS